MLRAHFVTSSTDAYSLRCLTPAAYYYSRPRRLHMAPHPRRPVCRRWRLSRGAHGTALLRCRGRLWDLRACWWPEQPLQPGRASPSRVVSPLWAAAPSAGLLGRSWDTDIPKAIPRMLVQRCRSAGQQGAGWTGRYFLGVLKPVQAVRSHARPTCRDVGWQRAVIRSDSPPSLTV